MPFMCPDNNCNTEEFNISNLWCHVARDHYESQLLQKGNKRRICQFCPKYVDAASNVIRHICSEHLKEVIRLLPEPWRNYEPRELTEKLMVGNMTTVSTPRVGYPEDFIRGAQKELNSAKNMLMTGDKSSNNIVADCSRCSFELVVKAVVKMSGGNPFKYHNILDLICDVGDDFSHLREIFVRIWKEMPEIHNYVDLHYKGLCWERQGPLSSEYFEQVDVQEILKKVEDVVKIVVEEEKTWRDKKKKKTRGKKRKN